MLTWIKGEPLPGGLVDDILKALKLERETTEERLRRSTLAPCPGQHESKAKGRKSAVKRVEQQREEESDNDDNSED